MKTRLALLSTSLGAVASLAVAAQRDWEGGTDASWIQNTNWVQSAFPTINDDVYIESNDGDWPQVTDNRSVASLTMRNLAEIEIRDSGETLTVSGEIKVSDNGTAYVKKLGSGDIVAGSFVIENTAGSVTTVTVEVSNGSILTN